MGASRPYEGGQDALNTASEEDIRKTYGALSRIYSTIEERFERQLRQRLLDMLGIHQGDHVLQADLRGAVGEGGRFERFEAAGAARSFSHEGSGSCTTDGLTQSSPL